MDWLDLATVLGAVALTWLPGALVLRASGTRWLTTLSVAPAVTFGVVALSTLVIQSTGARWSILWIIVPTILFAGVGYLLRKKRIGRGEALKPDPADVASPWSARDRIVLLVVGVGAAAVGGGLYLWLSGGFSVIPQDYDHVFQANVIRHIWESGDPSPMGAKAINDYESPGGFYYPTAWHALAALLNPVAGGEILRIYHAMALVWFIALPLSAVVVARSVRLRVWGAAAAIASSVCLLAFPWDAIWRGLMPFITSLVFLLPVVVLAVEGARRRFVAPGLALAIGLFGLVSVHTSAAASFLVLALPALLWDLVRSKGRRPSTFGWLVGVAGLVGAVLVPAALAMRTVLVGEVAGFSWPVELGVGDGILHAATLTGVYRDLPIVHFGWFVIPGLLLAFRRRYRWAGPLAVSTFIAMLLHVLTMSFSGPHIELLTQWWWDDPQRVGAMAALTAPVFIGIAVDQVRMFGSQLARRWRLDGRRRRLMAYGPVVMLLMILALACRVGLLNAVVVVSDKYSDGPTVTPYEAEAFEFLAERHPADRVMNDPGDGSVWMYALEGVSSVYGHFGVAGNSPHQELLYGHFDELATNPDVARVVAEENIRYAIVGKGFVFRDLRRAPGLDNLFDQPDVFREIFRNDGAIVYEIVGAQD